MTERLSEPAWVEGWRAAMDWLAEFKGAEGIGLADEMASRLPDGGGPEQDCAGCRALRQNRLTCHLHGLRDLDAPSVESGLGCDHCGKPHTHVTAQGFRGCDDHFKDHRAGGRP